MLKVADVDSERMLLRVERGKGVRSFRPFQRYFYTGNFLGRSYLRCWTVILTYALRASYRHQSADTVAAKH